MVPLSEVLTALAAGVSVIALSVGATLYVTKDSDSSAIDSEVPVAESVATTRRYGIGDAYFPCRDRIQVDVNQKVRNVNVDSHSSRYDDLRNDNVVFIDLQLLGESTSDAEDAQIVCRVSASSNEITAFQLRR